MISNACSYQVIGGHFPSYYLAVVGTVFYGEGVALSIADSAMEELACPSVLQWIHWFVYVSLLRS